MQLAGWKSRAISSGTGPARPVSRRWLPMTACPRATVSKEKDVERFADGMFNFDAICSHVQWTIEGVEVDREVAAILAVHKADFEAAHAAAPKSDTGPLAKILRRRLE